MKCVAKPGVLFAFSGDELGGAERNLLPVAAALPDYGFESSVLILGEGDGAGTRRARELGLSPLHVPLDKGRTREFAHVRKIQHTAVRLRKLPIDILYGVGVRAAAVAKSLLLGRFGVGYVGAQRTVSTRRHSQAQRVVAGRSGVIISNSTAGRDALVDVGFPEHRVHVILNGLQKVEPFRVSPGFRGRFICVANLLPDKGHEYLLEAFEQYAKESPEARLRLVGRDERHGELQSLVHRSEILRSRVEILGYVRNVSAELRAADAFVLPSLLEGMPTSALEAMAESLPVIATDVGGTSELIKDGETGLLVPPRDSGALLSAMQKLGEDAAFRERLAKNAHARVLANHTFERVMEQHVAVFSSLRGE